MTTFNTQYDYYKFLFIYFAITNALANFMDLTNRVIIKYLHFFIIVYIDNILIYSRNKEKHVNHVRVVLHTLKDHQLFS